ncbi:hypothetical protein UR09_06005 [Candidatus Nitromaritima sp. SCGC AAA799-A02]|nr:hypothetical protein UR09_06005 [Candidatus Nitromaritima sp. SCGC AAA799-A02]KMP10945.1 hypothetical protein UZ36_05980 [Candidatus Nitromaritima sp. SCGC AAA799-C22]
MINTVKKKSYYLIAGNRGFTLIEMIIAIVVIGIAIPTIMIPFSGLKDTKRPELTIQAAFLAQKHMESLASKTRDVTVCTGFPVTEEGYTINCTEIDVASTDLDTDVGSASFAKKVTLILTHPSMGGSLEFFTLFALDA